MADLSVGLRCYPLPLHTPPPPAHTRPSLAALAPIRMRRACQGRMTDSVLVPSSCPSASPMRALAAEAMLIGNMQMSSEYVEESKV